MVSRLHATAFETGSHESTYFLRLAIMLLHQRALLVLLRGLEATLLLDELVSGPVVLGLDLAAQREGVKFIWCIGLGHGCRRVVLDNCCGERATSRS